MNNKTRKRIPKEEWEYLKRKDRRELILDTIILGIVVIGVVLAMGFIVGVLDGQNCN